MFGYVKPCVPELRVKEHTCYRAVYCGLCKATGGGGCGMRLLPAKLALRYDTVFLALLRMMLEDAPPRFENRRCLLHPLRPRPMASPTEALCYSANIGSLLFAHSLRDHAADSRGIKGFAARLLLPYSASLRRAASGAIGSTEPDAAIEAGLRELSMLEQAKQPSPDRVAHRFGMILGDLFARGLPEPTAAEAEEIGYRLGKWIYLADAIDDLEKDAKSGAYNPLLLTDPPPSGEALTCAMLLDLKCADEALSRIEGGDGGYRAILENILRLGLPEQTRLLIQAKLPRAADPNTDPDSVPPGAERKDHA